MRSQARAFVRVALLVLLGALAGRPAAAQIFPSYIDYQGKLGDTSGNPLTGTYSFGFYLYTAGTGGSLLFTDTNYSGANALNVVNGVYSVQIGSLTAGGIPPAVFFSSEVWLEVHVQAGTTLNGSADVLSPRERLATAPFAFYSSYASYLGTANGVNIATFTAGGSLYIENNMVAAFFYGDGSNLANISGAAINGDIGSNAQNVNGVVAVPNGGTGSTTDSAARVALGLSANGSTQILDFTGTYGSLDISGSNSNYAGIKFTGVGGAYGNILMLGTNQDVQGFYNGSAWSWYFNAGVLTVGTVPAASINGGTFPNAAFTFPNTVTVGNLSSAGNISLTAANPSITSGSSYLVIPHGLYVSQTGVPLYTEAVINARNGIYDDTTLNYGGNMAILGGTGTSGTIMTSSVTVGGSVGAKGAGATDLTVTGTVWFGIGGSYGVAPNGDAAFADTPVQAPTFVNTWTNYGGGFPPASYWRDGFHIVHLDGLIGGGASSTCAGAAGSTIFTLPTGYQPPFRELFSTVTTGNGRLDIDTSGNVICYTGTTSYISLSGLTFRTTQP